MMVYIFFQLEYSNKRFGFCLLFVKRFSSEPELDLKENTFQYQELKQFLHSILDYSILVWCPEFCGNGSCVGFCNSTSDSASCDGYSWTVKCGSGTAFCSLFSGKISSEVTVRCGKVNWRILGRYEFCSGVTVLGGANGKMYRLSWIFALKF